ncbi:hypothetical protein F4677DRAFT_462478 [Hypoxylon crocopeplum]|nr:hypothetical protein F4677DRAFT_462478 [Hypoxylon crocopeplum]
MTRTWVDVVNDAEESCLRYGPVWLVLFVTFPVYANDFLYCWTILMGPQETQVGLGESITPANWYIGLCMMIFSAILKLNWFGAGLQVILTTWCRDRHWKPPNNASQKRILQADSATYENSLFRHRLTYFEGRRPRVCPFGCEFDLSDRVYHCTTMARCLPVYDHYCAYLQSSVYLRTIKPYCFLLAFLPLDAVYSFSVSLAALCQPSTRWAAPFVSSIISTSVIVFIILSANFPHNLKRLTWTNTVAPELDGEQWTLAFKYRDELGFRLQLRDFDKNPWDLGPRENFRQVFGQRWWKWPFFWWTPERVYRYGKYVDRDLPYADFVTREFTDLLLSGTTTFLAVAIDPPPPSSIRGEGRDHRHFLRSDVRRRDRQNSSEAPASNVGEPPQPQRGARRRTKGHSSSRDHDL